MNPNSFNATGTETNEPNGWDVLAETNTGNEGELTEATPDNNIAEVDTGSEGEAAPDTGKEGELPGDENDGWSVIDHPTEEMGTGVEKEGMETGTEREGDYTGDETAEPGAYPSEETGDETMTGTEIESYTPSTGDETA